MQIWETMGHQSISQKARPPTVPSRHLADYESQKHRLTDILLQKKLPFIKLSSNVKKMWNKMLPWQNNTQTSSVAASFVYTRTHTYKRQLMRSYKWGCMDHIRLWGFWGPKVPSHPAACKEADCWREFIPQLSLRYGRPRFTSAFVYFPQSLSPSLTGKFFVSSHPAYSSPSPRTLAKPCTSGMENDCHPSPSFHL